MPKINANGPVQNPMPCPCQQPARGNARGGLPCEGSFGSCSTNWAPLPLALCAAEDGRQEGVLTMLSLHPRLV